MSDFTVAKAIENDNLKKENERLAYTNKHLKFILIFFYVVSLIIVVFVLPYMYRIGEKQGYSKGYHISFLENREKWQKLYVKLFSDKEVLRKKYYQEAVEDFYNGKLKCDRIEKNTTTIEYIWKEK